MHQHKPPYPYMFIHSHISRYNQTNLLCSFESSSLEHQHTNDGRALFHQDTFLRHRRIHPAEHERSSAMKKESKWWERLTTQGLQETREIVFSTCQDRRGRALFQVYKVQRQEIGCMIGMVG